MDVIQQNKNISIHPPLAGRDQLFGAVAGNGVISIHPPLAGRDLNYVTSMTTLEIFQSTRPLRGGTADPLLGTNGNAISIHPPLAGRDTYLRSIRRACCHFNPPAPCGAGPAFLRDTLSRAHFNPPAPCGAGPRYLPPSPNRGDFNPPAPCGAGLGGLLRESMARGFQSTRPLRGGTRPAVLIHAAVVISIHPPLAGRDSDLAQKNCAKHRILHKKCIYPGRIERFSGFDAAIFLPNVHKFRCEPSEESLLAPRSHAYTIRTPSC